MYGLIYYSWLPRPSLKTFAVNTDTGVVALLVTVTLIHIPSGPNQIYPERPDV